MNRQTIGKITSALLLGILLGCYVHWDYTRWNRRGRDAFLAHEANRFEISMADPKPFAVTMFVSGLVAFGFLGVYELIALGVSSAVKSVKPDNGNS